MKNYRKKVGMVVYNNFLNDSRVEKEAITLIKAGRSVTIIALLDGKTKPLETKNNINVIRVANIPFYKQILSKAKSVAGREFNQNSTHSSETSGKISGKINFAIAYQRIVNIVGNTFNIFLRSSSIPTLGYMSKTIIYGLFLICLAELSIFLKFYEWEIYQRILIYGLINFFVLFRVRIFNYIKLRISRHIHREFCFLSFYRNVYKVFLDERCDVYHAHDLNTLPIAYLCAKRNKAKLIYDSHELYIERNKLIPSPMPWKYFLAILERFLIRRSDAVITVNKSIASEMAMRYKIPSPKVVMNTPVMSKRIGKNSRGNGQLRSDLSISDDRIVLLYVGAITFNRGLEELILSLSFLKDCHLVYLGYGNEIFKQKLIDMVNANQLSDRFSFYGPVPSESVIEYASDSDIGVAPIINACLSYYYCLPNKLFEYMNAGLPVVSSNFPELARVVLENDIGLTFDPADPRDIARSINQILSDPESRKRMASNAIQASKRYNWENESKKLLEVYNSL